MAIGVVGLVILMAVVSFFGTLIIGTLLLMLVARIFGQRKVFLPAFKALLITSLVVLVINFIPFGRVMTIILGVCLILLEIFLIKKFFKINWGKAIGMWAVLVAFISVLVILFVTVGWAIVSNIIQRGVLDLQKNTPF